MGPLWRKSPPIAAGLSAKCWARLLRARRHRHAFSQDEGRELTNTGQFVVVIASALLVAALVYWQYAEWERRNESWSNDKAELLKAMVQSVAALRVDAAMDPTGRSQAKVDSLLMQWNQEMDVWTRGRIRYLSRREVWRPIILGFVFGVVPAVILGVSWLWFSARNQSPAEVEARRDA